MERWKMKYLLNDEPYCMAKCIILITIILSLAIMPGKLVASAAPSQTTSSFDLFRIVEKSTSKRPDQLNAVTIYKRGKSFVLYTERTPTYRMPES
jgi:hypothetical protein